MHRIIARVERDPHYREQIDAALTSPKPTAADAISDAMRRIAQTLSVAAAVTYTNSGSSSLRAARERPSAPILSLTPHISTARRLALVWGLHSVLSKDVEHVEEMVDQACHTAVTEGFANAGDRLVIMAGTPFGISGTTNMLRIARVPSPSTAASGAPDRACMGRSACRGACPAMWHFLTGIRGRSLASARALPGRWRPEPSHGFPLPPRVPVPAPAGVPASTGSRDANARQYRPSAAAASATAARIANTNNIWERSRLRDRSSNDSQPSMTTSAART